MSTEDATIYVFSEILKIILKIILPFIIIIVICIISKIIYRYKKYGKVEFSAFKKREKIKFSDIVKNMIKKIEDKITIIENDNLYSDMIVVTESGIFLIKVIKYQGLIIGKRKEKKLKNKLKKDIIKEIDNPFYYLEIDKNKILKIDEKLQINTILVTSNNVNININDVNKEEVISLQNFYYTMEKNVIHKKIYTEEQKNEISKKINNIY